MDVIFHIGLHKTGTTFLQSTLFSSFQNKHVLYNPPEIRERMRLLPYLSEDEHRSELSAVRDAIHNKVKLAEASTLLLSHEGLSQLSYTQNYEESLALLHQLWPESKIIVFLRYQPNWLLSCYKSSVYSGDAQPIADFLGFRNGEFQTFDGRFNEHGLQQMDIHKANFLILLKHRVKYFSKENVHILRTPEQ